MCARTQTARVATHSFFLTTAKSTGFAASCLESRCRQRPCLYVDVTFTQAAATFVRPHLEGEHEIVWLNHLQTAIARS
jgi:hypothetical protein